MSAYARLKSSIQTAAIAAGGILQIALGIAEDIRGAPIYVFYPPPPEENGRDLQAGAMWEPESAIDLILQKVGEVLEKVRVSETDVSVGYLYDKITVGPGLVKTIETDLSGNEVVKISVGI